MVVSRRDREKGRRVWKLTDIQTGRQSLNVDTGKYRDIQMERATKRLIGERTRQSRV